MFFNLKKPVAPVLTKEEEGIIQYKKEIDAVLQKLENINSIFNMTTDFDMVSYAIHERVSLESHHSFLIKQIKLLKQQQKLNEENMIINITENTLEKTAQNI